MTERNERKYDAHKCFDLIWKTGIMTRSDAYKWLSKKLGISKYKCHIRYFTITQLTQTIKYSREILRNNGKDAPFKTKKPYNKYEARKK